jgi:hypothetical protein
MTVWCTSEQEADRRLAELLDRGWTGTIVYIEGLWTVRVVRPLFCEPEDRATV